MGRNLGTDCPGQIVMQTFLDYYRIPVESLGGISLISDSAPEETGFFQFGESNICYGRCKTGVAPDVPGSSEFNALKDVHRHGSSIQLPFDFTEVIENLRLERYRQKRNGRLELFAASEPVRTFYYFIRRCLPFRVRRQLQRVYFQDWKQLPFPAWPVDFTVDNLHEEILRLALEASDAKKVPFIWFWPDGAPSCLIMTHDVETHTGRDFTFNLMDLDDSYGFKASYQVIPKKRYEVPPEYVARIRSRGCEFNIHDLNHDGHLYSERAEFARRATEINSYVRQYRTQGFRAGAMYRKQDWYDVFEFSYDMSVPNVAHLEPVRGGCCTVMPYFIGKIVELPLTTAQDYSLFHILGSYSTALWEEQCRMILAGHGLVNVIVHPDYIMNKKSNNTYRRLLAHLAYLREKLFVWTALPGEINKWWRTRAELRLVTEGQGWRIEGEGKEKARIAYAHLIDGRLKYSFEPSITPRSLAEEQEVNKQIGLSQGNTGLQRPPNSATTSPDKIA